MKPILTRGKGEIPSEDDHALNFGFQETQTNGNNDVVIFYASGHDVSSIRNEESHFMEEDLLDQEENAQLLSHFGSHG